MRKSSETAGNSAAPNQELLFTLEDLKELQKAKHAQQETLDYNNALKSKTDYKNKLRE